MYKLAIVISSLGPGGAERVAAMQAKWFAEQNFEVSLITLDPSAKDHYDPRHANIARKRMPDNNPGSLFTYIQDQGFDLTIDHIHWHEGHYAFFEMMGASNQRLVIIDHSTYFYPLYFQSLWPIFEKRVAAYKNADVVSVLSRHSCQMFRQKLPFTVFVPNPLSYQSDAVSPVLQSKTIIAVANWQRAEKRLDRILEIFSGVSRRVEDAHLVLAGPVRQLELEDLMKRYDLRPEMVEAVGQQENIELFYLRSRLLLHASELEGLGLVLTEAGMHGLPRIVMDSPGIDEIVEHGVDGYLVEQGDTKAAVDHCVSLLKDDSLCQQMSAQALSSVKQFQPGIVGKRWEWLVNLAISNSSVSEKERLIAEDCSQQGVDKISIERVAHDYDVQLARLLRLLQEHGNSPGLGSDKLKGMSDQGVLRALKSKPAQELSSLSGILESRYLAKLVRQSGLFDQQWYEEQYPDVKSSRMDAALHYVKFGAAEGRNPSGNFDTQYYLSRNQGAGLTNENPLLHSLESSVPAEVAMVANIETAETAMAEKPDPWSNDDQVWLEEFSGNRSLLTLLEPDYLGIKQSASQFVSRNQMLFLKHDMDDAAIDYYVRLIIEAGPEKILVQGFPRSYETLLPLLRKKLPKIPIFCLYHGPFTQLRVPEERKCLQTLIRFYREGIFNRIGLVKKGMAETLQTIDVDTHFVMNFIAKIPSIPAQTDLVTVGIVGSEWQPLKPLFHQIAACKHLSYDEIRIVGSQAPSIEFCELFEINATHLGFLPQAEMPAFLAANTINLYVSLSECAPMLPLESLSEGVPCLFGANNHYFSDHQYLRSRLMVDVPDSETRIARYADIAIEERQQIISQYREYAQDYNLRAIQSFEAFLDIPKLEIPGNE